MADRPNILLILTDDQFFWSLDAQPEIGLPEGGMPKTTGWLSPGLTFNNAFVQTPLCAPSRISIMRGQNVRTHGIGTNEHAAWRFRNRGYGRDEIGYWLKNEAGYRTGFFGKPPNGYERIGSWQAPGYDRWLATLGAIKDPIVWNSQGTARKSSYARKNEARVLGEAAETFIANSTEAQPWFAFVSLNSPHSPYDPPNLYKGTYSNTPFPARPNFDWHDPLKPSFISSNPPLSTSEKNDVRDTWRGKMEELLGVDDAVDSLLSGVNLENTYVFFTTDNGFQMGEHRLRSKGHPYEEAIRVPLLVRGPGMVENATTNLLAANTDIAPTILELAGLDPTLKPCDGRSLTAPMFDETLTTADWREALFLEYMSDLVADTDHWQAIRTPDNIYIKREGGFEEYYDLEADPYQLSNIASEVDAVTIHEMSTRLAEMNGTSGEDLRAAEVSTTV